MFIVKALLFLCNATVPKTYLIGTGSLLRNAIVPKTCLPLTIPGLAHEEFRTIFEKCICQIILKHEDVAIPLFCRLIDSSPS